MCKPHFVCLFVCVTATEQAARGKGTAGSLKALVNTVRIVSGEHNRVLCGTVGHKSEEVAGDCRRLRNLYTSPNIIRVIKLTRVRWAGHIARMGEMRSVYKILIRKPEGKRSLGRHRRRLDWKRS
jgi:hypothetical protein